MVGDDGSPYQGDVRISAGMTVSIDGEVGGEGASLWSKPKSSISHERLSETIPNSKRIYQGNYSEI